MYVSFQKSVCIIGKANHYGSPSYVSVIRASVPRMNLDDTFEQKNEIAKAVELELEKAMSAYGYEIVQTLIVDIEPAQNVKSAMNEISAGRKPFCFSKVICPFECMIARVG